MLKKILSLFGAGAVLTSATVPFISKTSSFENNFINLKNNQKMNESFNTLIPNNFKKMINDYNNLSLDNKNIVAKYLNFMDEISYDEAILYIRKLDNNFIQNYQAEIISLYENFVIKLNQPKVSSRLLEKIDWSMLNEYLDIDFSDSSDFSVDCSLYGPAHWWTALWDWGWKIDFGGGIINVEKLGIKVYDAYGLKYDGLKQVLKTVIDKFKDIFNPEDSTITINQLKENIEILNKEIKGTKLPFKQSFLTKIDSVISLLNLTILSGYGDCCISSFKIEIEQIVSNIFGINEANLEEKYNQLVNIFDEISETLTNVEATVQSFYDKLPDVVVDFLLGSFVTIVNQMINAETNYGKGVRLKFQQFIIPQGFEARE